MDLTRQAETRSSHETHRQKSLVKVGDRQGGAVGGGGSRGGVDPAPSVGPADVPPGATFKLGPWRGGQAHGALNGARYDAAACARLRQIARSA